ncbi:MAG: aminotransferase class I/II-fold pyridoxal phosphate-dependent enzyme [Halobacteriaceae archaeon]
MFESIGYLEWMAGRPEAALYDLGTSALRGDRDHGREPLPGPVGDLDDPPAGVTLHTQLAAAYGVDPEQVVVTAGASHADFLAAAAALSEADGRVLVEKPGYEPLVRTPAALGAAVDRFVRPDGYRLDPDRVADAADDGTRLVAVTNRHNPSGRLADRETLAAAAAAARDADARLLVDEAYAAYLEAPTGGGPFGGVTAAGIDGAVVTDTLSKFPGLPELRVGWLVADAGFAETVRRVKHHVPAVADATVALAERVLHAERVAAETRELLRANADLLGEFVADRPALDGEVHTSYAFLDPPTGGDELAAAAGEEGLLVVPGRFFDDAGRVRVSLGRDTEDCAAALGALGAVLDR